jgi:hypothetical protein
MKAQLSKRINITATRKHLENLQDCEVVAEMTEILARMVNEESKAGRAVLRLMAELRAEELAGRAERRALVRHHIAQIYADAIK